MTPLLILLALVAFALGGWGASLVRSEARAGPFWASLAAGPRRTGALIAGGGLALLILVLAVRR
jgi:hypothetical protein